jgi:hypothetical protein
MTPSAAALPHTLAALYGVTFAKASSAIPMGMIVNSMRSKSHRE